MKTAISLFLLIICAGLSAQTYDKAWWFNSTVSTSRSLNNFGFGAEANLALDNRIFSLGYDYYNLPTKTSIGDAAVQDLYFTPGYQLFINDKFSLGFRFGVAVTRFEAPRFDSGGERIRFHRMYFPAKLRAAYDWSSQWGLFSELTFIPAESMYHEGFLVGKLGLRFGKLLQSSKPKLKKNNETQPLAITLGVNAGGSQFNFTPNVELGVIRKLMVLKLGYLTSQLEDQNSHIDMVYLSGGIEWGNGSFKPHVLTGVGRYLYFRRDVNRYTTTVIHEQSYLWFLESGISYYVSPSWAIQANLMLSPTEFHKGMFFYGSAGVRYGLQW